jgi:hypothetical protein
MLVHQLLLVAILHRNCGAEMSRSYSTSSPPLLPRYLFRIIIQIMLRKFTSRMLHSSSSPSMALLSQRRTSRDRTVNLLLCPSHNIRHSSGKLARDINLSPLSIIAIVVVVVEAVAVAVAAVVLTPL